MTCGDITGSIADRRRMVVEIGSECCRREFSSHLEVILTLEDFVSLLNVKETVSFEVNFLKC